MNKYLSMSKEYSKIEGIEDIGAVKNIGDSDVGGGLLENVSIVVVTGGMCVTVVRAGGARVWELYLRSDCGMVQQ